MKFFIYLFFFFVIPLTVYIRSTGANLCATSYYLPQVYNAPLGGALVVCFFMETCSMCMSVKFYDT